MPRIKLIDLRINEKLTQGDVAKGIGISRAHYARIENGDRNPSLKLALKIKEFFKYYDDDIFFENKCVVMVLKNDERI